MTTVSKKVIIALRDIILIDMTRNFSPHNYGYMIAKRARLSLGSVYPTLHKLEREGYLESYWLIPNKGRKRKYYEFTEVGRQKCMEKKIF